MPDTDCPNYDKERCPEICTPEGCPILREGKATPKRFLQKAELFHWLADHFVKNDKSHIIYGIFADILRFFEANKDRLNYSGMIGLQSDINKILQEGD